MESWEGLGGWESAEVECSLARKLKMCFERVVRRSQLVGEVPEEKASTYTERNMLGPNCEEC